MLRLNLFRKNKMQPMVAARKGYAFSFPFASPV